MAEFETTIPTILWHIYSNVTSALGDSPLVSRVDSPPVRCAWLCGFVCRWVSVLLHLPYAPLIFLAPLSCV